MIHQLHLDARIRDWVLLPIILVMFLFGILRHYVAQIMKSNPKQDATKMRQSQTLTRAIRLRENANYIPLNSFKVRKSFFTKPETGVLNEKIKSSTLVSMTDPTNMMEMMKNNMATLIPNGIILGWVSYFYSGFVIAKFPFPLTRRFRNMVQRDIKLNSLDVSYVTSLSIYFLFFFGLRGLFSLILGEENAVDDTKIMQQQMLLGGSQDMSALFTAEKEHLDLINHEFKLENSEDRLLQKFDVK